MRAIGAPGGCFSVALILHQAKNIDETVLWSGCTYSYSICQADQSI